MNLVRPILTTIALSLILAGCSSSKGKVTVRGDGAVGESGRDTVLAQSFNGAYISASHDGEFDVVLIQDPHETKPEPTKTRWSLKSLTDLKWPGSAQPLPTRSDGTPRRRAQVVDDLRAWLDYGARQPSPDGALSLCMHHTTESIPTG